MKLNSVEKRIGIVLIFLSFIILGILLLIWLFTGAQIVTYHMPDGQVFYYKRGYMETMLVEWLGITLLALPLFLCGLALFFGYGKKFWGWLRTGQWAETKDRQ